MSPEVVGEQLQRLRPMLRAICSQHLRCDSYEDLQQEVFVRLLPRIHSLRDGRALGAYARSITRNLCTDALRRKARQPRLQQMDDADWEALPSPHQELRQHESREHALAQVHRLPPTLREVARLHYLQGLDYRSIARRLQISVAAVGQRLTRARRSLPRD